ncbi:MULTISPECIES: terminase small subunit [Providencia]|uniref:terminase small subunit n=1 Tax=Providencia TaxID=586 RepID=UPI00313B20B3
MALTIKQEAFCQAYIENKGNASEAYRAAYATGRMKRESIAVEASKLLADPNVTLMISKLQQEHRDKHDVTVASLLEELEEARKAALSAETPQSAAAVAATMGKAKLTGLDKQIVELTGKNGGAVQVVSMSPDDIKRVMENDDC